MSLLYCENFKFSNDGLKKYPDFMDSETNHHSQQDNLNHGLMRYYSAPTSLLASLVDGTEGLNLSNNGNEDCRFVRSSSPEMENILSRFMESCNGNDNGIVVDSGSQNLQGFGVGERVVKQENVELVHQQKNVYRNQSHIRNENLFNVMNSSDFENSTMELQLGSRNCSNLFRQNSSPAEFFSHLTSENGFNTTRDVEKFGTCNRKNADAYPSSARTGNQLNFSGQSFGGSRRMPPIAEEENRSMGASSSHHCLQKANSGHQLNDGNFPNNSWDDSAIRDLKRGRDNNGHMFSTSIVLETPNGDSRDSIHGLTHHLSLPKSFNDKAPAEKFLRFQDPVPHQIRAKRGCATHPRSIAERVRRTRISDRIRKLQELFPEMDKQTSTADMLELAVEHIKGLQRQVKTLTDTKARCTCSSK